MEIYGLCEKNKRLSIYKINSIEWDGDAYLPANNLAYKYVATYTADVTEPDAATIYDITATAIYTLEGEVLADEDVVTIKKVGVFPISYVFDEMFTSPKDRAKSIIMKATKYRLPIVFSMDAIKSYEPCKRTGTTMLNILNILELNIFPRLYCFLARP